MIVSPDARGQVDPTIQRNILDHLPEMGCAIVPISYFPDFQFKEPNLYGQKWVLIDFTEGGCDGLDYDCLWRWIDQSPPILTFRRELKQVDASSTMLPIEFPAYLPIPEPQSKSDFMARPLEVLSWWGYSSQIRPLLHARIFEAMANDGINVLSHWDHFPVGVNGRTWMSVHTPHYSRRHINDILAVQMQSKLMVVLPGNGVKTFRASECVGCAMAMTKDDLAWSYPWVHGENCVRISKHSGLAFVDLLDAIERDDLYDIYVSGQTNLRNYYAPNYAKDYVAAEIRKAI